MNKFSFISLFSQVSGAFRLAGISLGLLTASATPQHSQATVFTFILQSPGLADTTSVYITGSEMQLGMWNPGVVKMESQGGHTWIKEITLHAETPIEYKYTLGSWAREGADSSGSPLPNFTVRASPGNRVNDLVSSWTSTLSDQPKPQGKITGLVKYHHMTGGKNIADRDVIVWLPPGYETYSKTHYPVIYMQDGQNVFDPATSAFGTDWQIDETADSLIRNDRVTPAIVVGIYNSPDRSAEYSPGEKGSDYMDFVVDKVKPFIDATYRTLPGREHTTAGGASSGGVIAFMLVWEHPDVFSKAICMSPAFRPPAGHEPQWNYPQTVKETKEVPDGVLFYIYNGGVGLEAELQPGVDDMIVALKAKGFTEGKDFVFVLDRDAQHNESSWAKHFPEAMNAVLKN